MIVFRNINPIEVNESEGRVIVEIDPIASEITEPTELEISTTNGSAIGTVFNELGVGVDFSPVASSIVTIDPQDPDSLTLAIGITDDEIAEPDEDFQLQVTSLADGNLNGTATVEIIDNDSDEETDDSLVVDRLLPQITIDNVEQLEGDNGSTDFEFTVSLSESSTEAIAVDYTTINGTGESQDRIENNSAIDLADYIPTNGTLEFEPGETTQTIVVEVLADSLSLAEEAPGETFSVNLSNVFNAEIETILGTGTILDDDLNDDLDAETEESQLTFLQLDDRTIIEGDEGETTTEELTVRLVDANGEPVVAEEDVTFEYSTIDITAAANVDYEFISSQFGTIVTGQSSVNIPITIIGDAAVESDETFLLTLSERETEITILDNDGSEELEIEDFRDNSVFRFFNSDTGGYFYTASETERDFVQQNLEDYVLERSSYASVNPEAENAEEIYRFYNPSTGGYFYTASEIERDAVIDNLDEFVFENIAFYAFDTQLENTIPVYRFFETNNGVHFYTADETERAFVEDNLANYNFEGIAFYALSPETDL